MRARLAVVALAVVLAVAACGTGEATPSPSPTAPPEPSPTVMRFIIDRTAWYAGLVVTVTGAVATIDENGGPVVVSFRIANPGTAAASLDVPVRLTLANRGYDPRRGTDVPEIDPGAAIDFDVTYDTAAGDDLTTAVVRIGRTADHQAIVPLAPGGPDAVLLEPVPVEVAGKVRGGDLQLTLKGGVLRWDLPDWNAELPRASVVLTLTYDAVDLGSFEGGIALTMDSVALRLPDGTEVGPRKDGRSQAVAVLLPKAVQNDLTTRFEIPSDARGTFTLIVRDGNGGQGTLRFKIPG